MSSPRTKMLTGASLGAPCMNSGSVTVALIIGTAASRGAGVGLDGQQAALALLLGVGLHLQPGASAGRR